MSTLKVNKLRDTAGSADAITLDPNGGAVLAGVTTVTSVKVGAAVTITESGIEASGIGITCANINGTQIGGRRNIVINGKAQINQRGDSTGNTSSGYYGPDRFETSVYGGTFSHSAAASGSTLSEFPKCFRIDCTSAASAASGSNEIKIGYLMEGQDVQHLQYGSSSAKSITLSFYVRSNKTETYTAWFYRPDGARHNAVNFSVSAANTWEKKIITIVGDTTSAINDDNTMGFKIDWILASGSDYKSGSALNGSWANLSSANRYVGNTGTFGESTDDVFDITGIQFEVGTQATAFEHRSYGEELKLCERYCETILVGESNGAYMNNTVAYANNALYTIIRFRTPKRATDPTLVQTTGTDYYKLYRANGSTTATGFTAANWPNTHGSAIYNSMTCTEGQSGLLGSNNVNALLLFTSEL